jgi:hypothetical protein
MGSSVTPKVVLVPWDPDSEEHVERLFGQRIACGWKSDYVQKWRKLQREGQVAFHWVVSFFYFMCGFLMSHSLCKGAIAVTVTVTKNSLTLFQVLSEDEPNREALLAKHISQYPSEKEAISDVAQSLGGYPRTPPSPPLTFIPVGHVSLDSQHLDPTLVDPSNGLYCISALYVSQALQGSGVGRAAFASVEVLAAGEPFFAKTLSLDTMHKNHYRPDDPIWVARGSPPPEVSRKPEMEFQPLTR